MALKTDRLGLSATITAQGIGAPDYQTILSALTDYFRQIYGTDAYLEPDSKDGQMIAIMALAIHDANNMAITCYNSFSPSTAVGDALTRNVKINGIVRKPATNSTVDLQLSGTPGTTIVNGSVRDSNNVIWNLPASVTIATTGLVTVTATCAETGPIAAVSGSVNQINTPTRGWQTVTNLNAAATGSVAETDAELRLRQAQSVSLTALTTFDALDGAISNIAGVVGHKLYQNDSDDKDANGLPGHTISAVVQGGDANTIADVIRKKKSLGVGTFGNTTITLADSYGTPQAIRFSRPVPVPVYLSLELKALTGYTSPIAEKIKKALAAYINNLGIGNSVLLSRLYSPANLTTGQDSTDSQYYDILTLLAGKSEAALSSGNIAIGYNEFASCEADNITISVTA
ncbi:baseplate J/gp47 family protein [Erwinia sp. DT-104]|uniref:baseplate J/gp47 family protein n=1 Tax=Erwinia sp. DT-104 TaxID=3396161 RepID=UPI003F1E07FC